MNQPNNIDKYPGYPHYPASEDITRVQNNNGKERIEDEMIVAPVEAASTDEEKKESLFTDNNTNLTPVEIQLLEDAGEDNGTSDNKNLKAAVLDNVDDDGDLLNETDEYEELTGEDLDIPGNQDDEAINNMGKEDEENNYYSEADTE